MSGIDWLISIVGLIVITAIIDIFGMLIEKFYL